MSCAAAVKDQQHSPADARTLGGVAKAVRGAGSRRYAASSGRPLSG